MASVGDINTITLPDGNTYDIRDTNAVPMTGATASVAGVSGLVPAPTASDTTKFLRGDGTWGDGGMPMVILSYGNSTWNDFINAYNNNVIVYCRASSNANPATGSQTRMAFMAYVNNATNPTEVEFQYYRSVSSHTANQQGDQVFVYKLTSASKWTVTTREAMARIVAGTNLSSTYSNNVLTINGNYSAMTGASSSTAGATGLVPAPSAGDDEKFLKGNGTWAETGGTVYADNIDMSSSDSRKVSTVLDNKADKSDTVLLTTLSRGRKANSTVGTGSFAFGDDVTASGSYTHAEGNLTSASGAYTHAEGIGSEASSRGSHAEGFGAAANAYYTHAEGCGTTAKSKSQHVAGEYNVLDPTGGTSVAGTYVEIIGNGTDHGNRSNARALDWSGNEYLKGDIYVECNANSTGGTKIPSASFTGATSVTDGSNGWVPAPLTGEQDKFLKGDGTWTEVDISEKADKVENATSGNFAGLDSNGNLTDSGHSGDDYLEQVYDVEYTSKKFVEKFWGSPSSTVDIPGTYIWSDGDNFYYSYAATQYILDKATSTWKNKTWNGLTSFYGGVVWSDGDNIYYSNSSNQYVLDKATSTWSVKTWYGLTSFSSSDIWTDGDNFYYSSGSTQYILDKSTSTWSQKTWNGVTSFSKNYIWSDGENIYCSNGSNNQYILDRSTSTWNAKTWNGFTAFNGSGIWTDGENIYYSSSSDQYVLDKATSTWSQKIWNGLTSFSRNYIWSDGDNIYYSVNSSTQYVLDKATSTWSVKTWISPLLFTGEYVWSDGENIYYSNNYTQYALDKTNSLWIQKTWNGVTTLDGRCVWSDGENIYYSNGSSNYILDKSTSTWNSKSWAGLGLDNLDGINIWSDGEYFYYSSWDKQYVLDKATSTWSTKTWNGITQFYGGSIWSDGENIYYSGSATVQYILDKATSTWNQKVWNGFTGIYGSSIWSDGDNIYYSNSSNQYVLDKATSTWNQTTWSGLTNINGKDIWTDEENAYYSNTGKQYVLTYNQDQILIGKNGRWTRTSLNEFIKQIPSGTLRVVPFSIDVASWSLSNEIYSYTCSTVYVTSSSIDFIEYDDSFREALLGDIKAVKVTGGGGILFTTDIMPVATLSGEIRIFDSDDGRYSVALQDTVVPVVNGGTGANTLQGAKDNLGITALENQLNNRLIPIESTTLLVSSVPDRTAKSVCKLSLPAGTWLVYGKVSFINNKAGVRGIQISKNNNYFGWVQATSTGYGSGSDHDLTLNGSEIIESVGDEYVYLCAYVAISATNNLNAAGTKIWAVKLAD